MDKKVNFFTLAEELGGRLEEIQLPNGVIMKETKWDPAPGRALLAYFDSFAERTEAGQPVEFEGHTDPWVMLGVLHRLRNCRLSTYLSVFQCSVPLEAYGTGLEPVPGQPVLFQVTEEGNRVFLRLKAGAPTPPYQMDLHEMNLPPIPEGKDIYLELGNAKILNLLGVALSLGSTCRTLFMEQGERSYRCAISNTPEIQPGDDRER